VPSGATPTVQIWPNRVTSRYAPALLNAHLSSELGTHCFVAPKNHDPRNPVLQFTNVPWPVPLSERLQYLWVELRRWTTEVPRKFVDKVLAKMRYVLLPFSQGRETNPMFETA